MTEGNPVTGQPHGGRDEQPDADGLPGERPLSEGEQRQASPENLSRESDTASRAPQDGQMPSKDRDLAQPTPGIPKQVHAPSPADATDADPPGGSVANQPGRVPDQ